MAIITLEDVRAAGLTDEEAADDLVESAILTADSIIREATGTWFEAVVYTVDAPLLIDGAGGNVLSLPAPIVQLDKVLEEGAEIALTDLAVYGKVSVRQPDDRFNPRLLRKPVSSLLGGSWPSGGYDRSGPRYLPTWIEGPQSIALVGVFGFVEADGVSPPPLIKKTALRLVMREWRPVGDPLDAEAHASGQVVSETTDGHSYTLGGVITSNGVTGNPLIDDVLARYRRRFGGLA